MWVNRSMMRILLTAYRINMSILTELNITVSFTLIIYQRILKYFGHITKRREGQIKGIVRYFLFQAAQYAQQRK